MTEGLPKVRCDSSAASFTTARSYQVCRGLIVHSVLILVIQAGSYPLDSIQQVPTPEYDLTYLEPIISLTSVLTLHVEDWKALRKIL